MPLNVFSVDYFLITLSAKGKANNYILLHLNVGESLLKFLYFQFQTENKHFPGKKIYFGGELLRVFYSTNDILSQSNECELTVIKILDDTFLSKYP